MKKNYIPDTGDIILLDFCPSSGHEQGGYRPALVLSPQEYNQKTELAVCCPITSQIKGYPFEVPIPGSCDTEGVILCDHLKNLSWKNRKAKYRGKVPLSTINQVRKILSTFLSLDPQS